MVHVSVQGRFVNQTQWVELAKATDHSGFDCLYVADHLGSSATPFAALAAAAVVTDTVRPGTCVLNAGLREPLSLAAELATLDALSSGRTVFGVGAGHTPAEWTMLGLEYPQAGERVDRLIELVSAVRLLLTGEPVTTRGGPTFNWTRPRSASLTRFRTRFHYSSGATAVEFSPLPLHAPTSSGSPGLEGRCPTVTPMKSSGVFQRSTARSVWSSQMRSGSVVALTSRPWSSTLRSQTTPSEWQAG